ncbi:MAG: nucleotidyltransferase domain-containing protein [Oscillospiraceae bacterium]|nr:nucleotidyltransferase domain-containing protein [Oscillospiraceae bacterium]
MERIYSLDEIKNLLSPIFAAYPVRKATLFGSYARGEADNGSDLDIVLDSDYNTMGLRYYEMWDNLSTLVNKSVDLIEEVELRENTPIYNSIQKDGVIIYDNR